MLGTLLLNRYRIEAELGQGGMGRVYRAHDLRLNRAVAVKVLTQSGLDTQGRARLLAEAQAAARLNHANIVTVYDADEADGQPFIVMELVQGPSLRALLPELNAAAPGAASIQGRTPLTRALQLARQVCAAIESAHVAGIIHRDIKPENVLVTTGGSAKLMDFGLAYSSYDAPTTSDADGPVVGTAAYLAPELLQGEEASPQSDLYAFGVLLYEVLTGQPPFLGNLAALIGQHLHAIPYPPSHHNPDVTPELDDLALRLLAKTPGERPESAHAVGRSLDRLLGAASSSSISSETIQSLRPPLSVRHNLPAVLGNFIGREKEVREIQNLLGSERLVTLTGSGGVGKTRLSLQVAQAMLPACRDGVWLVELAALTDPELVALTIAEALGLSYVPNPNDPGHTLENTLGEFIRSKNLLVVLDNCEHLIESAARCAELLLRHGPEVRLLASSREALGLPGERPYHVPSLSLPRDAEHALQAEAVQLFVERAAAVRPGFALTPQNAAAVSAIVQRLDGIALAIELAAARIKSLAPEQLAARLDDRFRLLTGGSRTALPRQQTLRAAIDWSYSLLSTDEKTLLARLAVFLGGWSLEAAEAVCADERAAPGSLPLESIFDLLESLVNKSLVLVEEQPEDENSPEQGGAGVMRYRMLETVRQYAREKLFDSPAPEHWRDRHLACLADFAEQTAPGLSTSAQILTAQRLGREMENIHQALDWAAGAPRPESGDSLHPNTRQGLRLAGALWWYGFTYQQATDFTPTLDRLLQAAQLSPTMLAADPQLAAALPGLPMYYLNVNAERAWEVAQQLSALLEPLERPELHAIIRYTYSLAQVYSRQALQAEPSELRAAVELALRLKNEWLAARMLYSLGHFQGMLGRLEDARASLQQSLALARQIGDARGLGIGLARLGILTSQSGDIRRALSLTNEALGILRRMKLALETAQSSLYCAQFNLRLGRYPEARRNLEEATLLVQKHTFYRIWCMDIWSEYYFAIGDVENCAAYGRRSLQARRQLDGGWDSVESAAFAHFGLIQRLARLGDAAEARRLWDEKPVPASYGVYYPPNLAAVEGILAIAEGRGAEAVAALKLALKLGLESLHDTDYASYLLENLAFALQLDGKPRRAARLWAAARAMRQNAGMVIWPGDQAWFDRFKNGLLAALGEDGFNAAWQAGSQLLLEQAVAEALEL